MYILLCEGNLLYTGIAKNPEQRLRQHLGIIKGGAKFTRSHRVIRVMALWEDKSDEYARKLECFVKKLSRSDKQRLIETPDLLLTEFRTDIPAGLMVYVNPKELNEKYELK